MIVKKAFKLSKGGSITKKDCRDLFIYSAVHYPNSCYPYSVSAACHQLQQRLGLLEPIKDGRFLSPAFKDFSATFIPLFFEITTTAEPFVSRGTLLLG
ncbi:hypothetical protein [uncultured Limosilactobacillus sp.]|uniref:hypothetical protein n=1 Tax=uncultured Limosilactobacillus sp. TaxID=2837629 RepID=UPI0025F1A9F9|nr:hypothetical protein [uncultured Limosilactobacillus sp.]